MVTFERWPQLDDVLAESRKAWSVTLPSRGGAAMWEGWSEIGYNGPIPIFHDAEAHARELAQAAEAAWSTSNGSAWMAFTSNPSMASSNGSAWMVFPLEPIHGK